MRPKLSHDELVVRAVRWLKGAGGCGVAVPELACWQAEQPDAIGWRGRGSVCIIVECKVSRADFMSDKRKEFRRRPEIGTGNLRYYLTPENLVSIADLPPRWGLLEVHGRKVLVRKRAEPIDLEAENTTSFEFMYSLLRRADLRGALKPCLSKKWSGD